MKTPETSRLFTKKTDPKSGVEYYLLTHKITKYQQGFYFCNDCMTKDGRYLWFYVAAYDSLYRLLGVIDFEEDDMYYFEDSLFFDATPYIDVDTGDAYYVYRNSIYKHGPKKGDEAELVATVPTKGAVRHLATHLTRTPDKKEFLLDILEGNHTTYVGTVNVETGVFTKWADCDFNTNHGQMNPVNPDIALAAYDYYDDIITGESFAIPSDENGNYLRLWTITRDGKRTTYPPHNDFATHEFWSADGKKIYYENPQGIHRINLETGEHINVHECNAWHAFANRDETLYLYDTKMVPDDEFYRGGPAAVRFYNAVTDKEIDVASYLIPTGTPENPFNYHPDPHPRFVGDEKYVLFTTSECGGLDIAMVKTEYLIEMTK